MRCPNCGQELGEFNGATCPYCQQPLASGSAAEADVSTQPLQPAALGDGAADSTNSIEAANTIAAPPWQPEQEAIQDAWADLPTLPTLTPPSSASPPAPSAQVAPTATPAMDNLAAVQKTEAPQAPHMAEIPGLPRQRQQAPSFALSDEMPTAPLANPVAPLLPPLLPPMPRMADIATMPTPSVPKVASSDGIAASAAAPVSAAPAPVRAPAPTWAPPVEIPPTPAPVKQADAARRGRKWQIAGAVVLLLAIIGGITGYVIISQNPTIYQSSLKGSLDDSWENNHICTEKSDGYHITGGSICYVPVDSQTNADISVTVAQLSGPGDLFYGVVLRSTPEQHYYLFGLNGNGEWTFANISNAASQPTYLVQPTLDGAIHSGQHQTNTLEVKAKGAQFNFFINGTQVGQVNDEHYTSGLIGLSGEDGVEVVYTNLRIGKLE